MLYIHHLILNGGKATGLSSEDKPPFALLDQEPLCPLTDLVSHQAAEGAPALRRHPPGDAAGADLARLGDHDVAELLPLPVVVQDELGQLGGLAAAGGAADDHHGVALDEGDQLQAHRCSTQAESQFFRKILQLDNRKLIKMNDRGALTVLKELYEPQSKFSEFDFESKVASLCAA